MITPIATPDPITHVGNPAAYVLQTDQPAGTLITLRLLVAPSLIGAPVEVFQATKPAGSDQRATFHVHRVLRDHLQPTWPSLLTGYPLGQQADMVRQFKAAWADTDPEAEEAVNHYALPAAWEYHRFPTRATRLASGTDYLTIKPFTRRVRFGMPEFLTYMPNATAEITITLTVFYTDETSSVINYTASAVENQPIFLAIGDDRHQFRNIEPTKTIRQVSVSVAGVPACRLKFEEPRSPYIRQFYFVNRLGGFDSFFSTGKGQESIQPIGGQSSERFLPYNYNLQRGQYEAVQPKWRKEFEVASGYLPASEYESLLDIMGIGIVFEWRDGQLIRINPVFEGQSVKQDGVYQHYFNLKYTYADTPTP